MDLDKRFKQEAYSKEKRALQSRSRPFPNDSRDGEKRLVKENHSSVKWAQEIFWKLENMLENKFSIIGLVCFLRSQVWASSVLTAAMGTNWVTTLCLSTVHVGNLGSYVTVQLGYRSLTLSGSACFAFWLAGSCVMQSKAQKASGDYAGSHGHQHQSLSEDNADSVCHSAVPQTRTRVLDSFGELLKFKEHVFFQQWLNPQHYCPLPLVKPLFLSLPSQDCANSNAKCQWLIFTQSKTMWRTKLSVSLISKSPWFQQLSSLLLQTAHHCFSCASKTHLPMLS